MTAQRPERRTRLLLLRHGDVESHRGDVPITPAGVRRAERAGERLAGLAVGPLLYYGGTRRTRETARALARGAAGAGRAIEPQDNVALRNPDLYAAGIRVNMVSSAAALAEQVPHLTLAQAAAHPWWSEFFVAPDRIGWWLRQSTPPGESSADLARRILRFATSLDDDGPSRGRLVIGVTHSPVLRSVLLEVTGHDPGEPGYLKGLDIRVCGEAQDVSPFDPLSERMTHDDH